MPISDLSLHFLYINSSPLLSLRSHLIFLNLPPYPYGGFNNHECKYLIHVECINAYTWQQARCIALNIKMPSTTMCVIVCLLCFINKLISIAIGDYFSLLGETYNFILSPCFSLTYLETRWSCLLLFRWFVSTEMKVCLIIILFVGLVPEWLAFSKSVSSTRSVFPKKALRERWMAFMQWWDDAWGAVNYRFSVEISK